MTFDWFRIALAVLLLGAADGALSQAATPTPAAVLVDAAAAVPTADKSGEEKKAADAAKTQSDEARKAQAEQKAKAEAEAPAKAKADAEAFAKTQTEDASKKCQGSRDKDGKPCQSPTVGKMYPPTSQLTTWPMRIFVTASIPEGVVPTLAVVLGHAIPRSADNATQDIESGQCGKLPAVHVARNQLWSGGANVDGQTSERAGTWLLFDVSKCSLPGIGSMSRAHLVLKWTGDGKPCTNCTLVSSVETSLGSATCAVIYSILMLAAFTGIIVVILKISKCSIVGFFLTDARLSLSMVQMAMWTYTVGFVVLFDLFVRLDAASIPGSLIVLMTSSLLTAGMSSTIVGAAKTSTPTSPLTADEEKKLNDSNTPEDEKLKLRKKQQDFKSAQADGKPVLALPGNVNPPKSDQADPESRQIRIRLLELFTLPEDPTDGSKLSLSRVQMLFWTVVIIVMFISKSLLSPELWEVPWTLVALMGVSQLGYLAGKYGYAPPATKG